MLNELEVRGFCTKYFVSFKVHHPSSRMELIGGMNYEYYDRETMVTAEIPLSKLTQLATNDSEYAQHILACKKHPAVKDAYDKYMTLLKLTE